MLRSRAAWPYEPVILAASNIGRAESVWDNRRRASAPRDGRRIWQWSMTRPCQAFQVVEPEAWLEGSATGSPEQCAAAVRGQPDLGVDAVILHGGSPEILRRAVAASSAGTH